MNLVVLVNRFISIVLPVIFCQLILSPAIILFADDEPATSQILASSSFDSGRLLGVVTDPAGIPIEGTIVSATGQGSVSVAVCDSNGRFEFRSLRPGQYLLRTHSDGQDMKQRSLVEVKPGLSTVHSIRLHYESAPSLSPELFTAGFGVSGRLAEFYEDYEQSQRPEDFELEAEIETETGESDSSGFSPHDDSEKAWRLRRARRSVLKDSGINLLRTDDKVDETLVLITPFLAADQTASALTNAFPVSGQFHLLTRAKLQSSSELWSKDILPGQIAHASLGGAEQGNRWKLRGAMRTGGAGSWALAGSYVAEPSETHTLAMGVSYSRQHFHTLINEELMTLGSALREKRDSLDASRAVGSLSIQGAWQVVPNLTLDYGTNVARYDYLPAAPVVSPNAGITVEPINGTRARVEVGRNVLVPGAEEFLPPADGVWLPPERTFAPLSSADSLNAETSQYVEVALERDLAQATTVGIRWFHQDVDNQLVALFGFNPESPVSLVDHYYVTNAGGVSAEGFGVMFSHLLGGRVWGTLDYSVANAEWLPLVANSHSFSRAGILRTGTERVHDVTTSIETQIPETATEVFFFYRLNTAFAVIDSETNAITSDLDGRFAVRVKQTLPFSPIEGSDWEVLVDIRSLFREEVAGASVYDELLVAKPPRQVVGGLVVHF